MVNPTWQINKQFFWQEIGTFTSSAAAGIAFDEPGRQILVVGDNNISKFDINTLKLTEYLKETVGTQTGYSGEAIYNPDKQETYFYNLADIGKPVLSSPLFRIRICPPVSFLLNSPIRCTIMLTFSIRQVNRSIFSAGMATISIQT